MNGVYSMDERKPLHRYRQIIKPFLVIVNKRIIFRRYIRHLHILMKAQSLNKRRKYSAKFTKDAAENPRINSWECQ